MGSVPQRERRWVLLGKYISLTLQNAELADIPQMTYETTIIPRALKPYSTRWPGLAGTVRIDRPIGDRKRAPMTLSHFEGMVRAAQYTCVASVDVNAPGSRPVMAARDTAAARRSAAGSALHKACPTSASGQLETFPALSRMSVAGGRADINSRALHFRS